MENTNRSSHQEVFFRKGVLKVCIKFTGEHSCRSEISIKLQSNFIEIILPHECSPVNLLHVFRTPFPRNNSGGAVSLLTLSVYKIFIKALYKRLSRSNLKLFQKYLLFWLLNSCGVSSNLHFPGVIISL